MTVEQLIEAYPKPHTLEIICISVVVLTLMWGIVLVTRLARRTKKTNWIILQMAYYSTIGIIVLTSLIVFIDDALEPDALEYWATEYLQPYIDNTKVTEQELNESEIELVRDVQVKGLVHLRSKADGVSTLIMKVGYREDELATKPCLRILEYDEELIDFLKQKDTLDVVLPSKYYLIVPKGYFDGTSN